MIGQRIQANAPTVAISNLGNPNDLVSFHEPCPNADPTTNAQCTTMAVGCVAVVTAARDLAGDHADHRRS